MENNNNTQNKVILSEKNIADNVLMRVGDLEKSGGLQIPKNYSAANALKSAWLILQNTFDKEKRAVLQVCTKESVANTLLDMIIQGLSPAKKQCYFIAYGNQLQLTRSYMGTIAVTKRIKTVKDIFANCIYEGDEFEYTFDLETGLKKIIKHNQKFTNIDTAKILGAYAIIIREGMPPFVEIMNIKQIRAAWEQGAAKGESKAHLKFTDEMAKKSVINRACKTFWNTSDDSDLLIDTINRTTDMEDMDDTPIIEESSIASEIEDQANKQEIDINLPPQNESTDLSAIDWENPITIVAKIESFSDLAAFNNFINNNKNRLDSFGGRTAVHIEDAISIKLKELRGNTSTLQSDTKGTNKKAPF